MVSLDDVVKVGTARERAFLKAMCDPRRIHESVEEKMTSCGITSYSELLEIVKKEEVAKEIYYGNRNIIVSLASPKILHKMAELAESSDRWARLFWEVVGVLRKDSMEGTRVVATMDDLEARLRELEEVGDGEGT